VFLHRLPPLFTLEILIPQSLVLDLEPNVVQQQFPKFFQPIMYSNMHNLGWFVQLYLCQFQLPLLVLDLRMQGLGLFFQVYVNKNHLLFLIIIRLFQIDYGFFLLHIELFHLVVVSAHMFMVILKCLKIIPSLPIDLIKIIVFTLQGFCFHCSLLSLNHFKGEVLVFDMSLSQLPLNINQFLFPIFEG